MTNERAERLTCRWKGPIPPKPEGEGGPAHHEPRTTNHEPGRRLAVLLGLGLQFELREDLVHYMGLPLARGCSSGRTVPIDSQ